MTPNAASRMRPDAARWLMPNQKIWQWTGRPEQKYSPDQPRVPSGNSDGGQWTTVSSGGGISIAVHTGDSATAETDELSNFSNELLAGIGAALNDLRDQLARIRLAGDIPTGDSPLKIPKIRPSTTRERNTIVRLAARRLGPYVWLAVEAGHWFYEHRAEFQSFFDAPKTLAKLQAGVLNPQPGYDVHHIVEQSAARDAGFSEEEIDGQDNLVAIPRWKHWEINAWFQRPDSRFGGLSPRSYLTGKPWDVRRAVGLRALIDVGVLKP